MFAFTRLGYEKKAFLKADSPENDGLAAKLTELFSQAQVSYTSSNFNKEKFEFVLSFEEGKISAVFFKDIKPEDPALNETDKDKLFPDTVLGRRMKAVFKDEPIIQGSVQFLDHNNNRRVHLLVDRKNEGIWIEMTFKEEMAVPVKAA